VLTHLQVIHNPINELSMWESLFTFFSFDQNLPGLDDSFDAFLKGLFKACC